ncbi:MAG: LPS export ABC transporter periplasmic protein LptC [Elusimicrobiaceae bacterium]|nr:LPS export ABC transporter periplasmic protein LptC [Elusimicrobiaceae bacterium]
MKKLVFLLSLAFCLSACSAEEEKTAGEDLQRAENVTLFESKDSQHKWMLRAEKVDFDDLNSAVLHNPHLLLRENGKDSAEVSGQRGTFDYAKKLVSIEGNALVKSFTEQVTLATDRFFYDVDKDRIWSDKKTTVTRATAKITARGGIETDSKLTRIEFKKQSTQLPKNLKEAQGVRP